MKIIHVGIVLLACLAVGLAAVASRAGSDRIAFLNIRMVQGELTLENVTIVEGRLKTPKTLHLDKGKLYCEVLDVSGKRLFETVVHDPSIQRFEYADDEGMLHSKIVTRDDAFFSIRIPYGVTARTVKIYRIDTAPGGKKLVKRALHIGSLSIDLLGGGYE